MIVQPLKMRKTSLKGAFLAFLSSPKKLNYRIGFIFIPNSSFNTQISSSPISEDNVEE